jgi:hypothetical protein
MLLLLTLKFEKAIFFYQFSFFTVCGLNTKPEPEPELVKSRNLNRNKYSYGSSRLLSGGLCPGTDGPGGG